MKRFFSQSRVISLWDLFADLIRFKELSIDEIRIRVFGFFSASLAIPMLLGYAFYHAFHNQPLTAGFNILVVLSLTVFFVKLRSIEKTLFIIELNVALFGALFIHFAFTGIGEGSGLFWTVLYPVLAVFFLGGSKGEFWVGVIGIIILILLFFQDVFGGYPYGHRVLVRWLCIYLMMAILVYGFEHLRQATYDILVDERQKLENALAEIKTLQGIIPICAHCKQIRDDKGIWKQIELYLSQHSDATFSHGICPACSEKLYGHHDWYKNIKAKREKKS